MFKLSLYSVIICTVIELKVKEFSCSTGGEAASKTEDSAVDTAKSKSSPRVLKPLTEVVEEEPTTIPAPVVVETAVVEELSMLPSSPMSDSDKDLASVKALLPVRGLIREETLFILPLAEYLET
jgi:hypothetical protein